MQCLEDPASAFDSKAKTFDICRSMSLYPRTPYKELRAGAPHLKPESKKSHSYSGGKQEKSLSSICNHSFA